MPPAFSRRIRHFADALGAKSWRKLFWAVCVLTSAAALAGCSGQEQVTDAPEAVETVGMQMPESPVTDRVVRCMQEAGWTVRRSLYGGIESEEMSQDQQSAWQAAHEKCAESTGWNATNELNESQRKELYRQEVATHECLTTLGIESNPPPSEQTYLDTFQTQEWYFAFQPGFDQLDTGKLNQAILTCPPPTWFMNISGFEDAAWAK